MKETRTHYCESYQDEIHVPQGEHCPYCGWLAIRPITPHKGGRTKQIQCRITPDTLEKLQAILTARKITLADWIEEQVNAAG